MLGEALTTAATLQETSASALTRSMSTWSITAMSPGRRRLVRFFVRRSSRTVPETPGPVSWVRPRRRVPMRMRRMVSRGRRGPVVRRATATFRSRRVSDTTAARHARIGGHAYPQDRYRLVTSVAAVTGVAHALTRTAPVPGTSPDEQPEPAAPSTGTVIRAVPSVRPEVVTPSTEPSEVTTPSAPEGDGAPQPSTRRDRRAARGPGLRERRRQETRARIVDAAEELFAERGFDAVSVMEIARHARVVEKTVFNHFPVKEGLVFDADPPIRAALLDAVRRRPAGESVSAAAGSFVVAVVGMLGTPEAAEGVARMARVIRGSRTLQVREREILRELTHALADL